MGIMNYIAMALLLVESSAMKWTIGLDGDEDLGEEIIIGGEPFRFHQKETQMAQLEALSRGLHC